MTIFNPNKFILFTINILICTHVFANESPKFDLDRFHFEEKILPQKIIKVRNPYGDIRVRPAPKDTLMIHAVYQKIGENPYIPDMQIERTESGINFNFIYPKDNVPERLTDGRIDVVVIIPEHVKLDLEIERGNLQTKKLKNPIKVYSDSSNIKLNTTENFDLYTRAGSIDLQLPALINSNGTLKTSIGNIDVFFQLEKNIAFDVKTSASISSNDLELMKSRIINKRKQLLKLGTPHHKLKIESDTGHVRLINNNHIYH
jgi:hypothetical protein